MSINSTSANRSAKPAKAVPEQSTALGGGYVVMSVNDLGMHCGDLDTRVLSILPPYNVLHAQVIQKGPQPQIMGDGQVSVFYSAASTPFDHVFDPANPQPPGFTQTAAGLPFTGVYKTNFWDTLNKGAYTPFYPVDILAGGPIPVDLGLIVPDPAFLPALSVAQQAMPGIAGPYTQAAGNVPQAFKRFDTHLPFFANFIDSFGYFLNDLNWFSADGIPITTFDDVGRVNPYPLARVSAFKLKPNGKLGNLLATIDTVMPISGEADCKNCHTNNDPANGGVGGYTATATGVSLDHKDASGNVDNPGNISTAFDDPLLTTVPLKVSVEYAQDRNILRFHDRAQGAKYVDSAGNATPCTISRWKYRPAAGFNNSNGTPAQPLQLEPTWPNGDQNCLSNKAIVQGKPVVCQVCHYTPALDLAQVGPLGGSLSYNDTIGLTNANGRAQRDKPSMSRAIHDAHKTAVGASFVMPSPDDDMRAYVVGTVTTVAGDPGFDTTCNPPNASGVQANATSRLYAQCTTCANKRWDQCVTQNTCENCHPGRYTKCLRGTMAEAGMLCQDCHGNMAQVGNDFTVNMHPATATAPAGVFPDVADLTKRVPWAHEPGCQSCHVGDAVNQPSMTTGYVYAKDDAGADIPFVLLQAWAKGDTNATPIAAPNSRFAEDSFGDKRILYRLSKGGDVQLPSGFSGSRGHKGVACELCHGSTHAEWPVTPNHEGAWPPPAGTFVANDNTTAGQLQGHTGKIIECDTCHTGTYSITKALQGPHNMHPVGSGAGNYSQWWVSNHGGFLGQNPTFSDLTNGCGVCHGKAGEGTILSEAAITRVVKVPDFIYKGKKIKVKNQKVTLNAGDAINCGLCHANPFGPG